VRFEPVLHRRTIRRPETGAASLTSNA
jgi:hypothetical protein